MIILILEIAAGIAAYYFMKKKLTEKYSEDFVKSVKWMLISPIVQVLVFIPACVSAIVYTNAVTDAMRLQSIADASSIFEIGFIDLLGYGIGSEIFTSDTSVPGYHEMLLSTIVTAFTGLVAAVSYIIMAKRLFCGIFNKGSVNRVKTAHKITLLATYAVEICLTWRTIYISDYVFGPIDEKSRYTAYIGLIIVMLVLGFFFNKFMKSASVFFAQREADMAARQATAEQPSPAATPSSSKVEQLKGLKDMLDRGILTQEEFDNEKRKLLNQ